MKYLTRIEKRADGNLWLAAQVDMNEFAEGDPVEVTVMRTEDTPTLSEPLEPPALVHTGQAIGWYNCDGRDCPVCGTAPKPESDVMQNPSLIPGGPGFVGQEANQREATAKPNDASLIAAILEVAQLTDDTEDGGTVFMPDEEEWGIIVGLARERAKPKSEPKP